ncbi:MAG TPA: transposase [Candidatus Angelobacter sp.]
MHPGQIERRTHDYKRHGTTSLFAAFDIASGRVLGQLHRRHCSREFRKFLDAIEATCRRNSMSTSSLDNNGTHKTELIRRWLAKRPRFHVRFTPTSASWLNLVECWFATLTRAQQRNYRSSSCRAASNCSRRALSTLGVCRSSLSIV